MTDRQAIRSWAQHVDRAIEERPACDAQVVLDADGTVPYGGSVAILCLRRRREALLADTVAPEVDDHEVDGVIAAVLAACWAT